MPIVSTLTVIAVGLLRIIVLYTWMILTNSMVYFKQIVERKFMNDFEAVVSGA